MVWGKRARAPPGLAVRRLERAAQPNPRSCDEIEELLPLYPLGVLDHEETAAVESHVAICPACAAELLRYEAVTDMLGEAVAPDLDSVLEGGFEPFEEILEIDRLIERQRKMRGSVYALAPLYHGTPVRNVERTDPFDRHGLASVAQAGCQVAGCSHAVRADRRG